MNVELAAVIRPGTLTACCERVPAPLGAARFVCRGCGTIYTDARRIVERSFGPVVDVTPMTPRRLRAVGHALVWVDD